MKRLNVYLTFLTVALSLFFTSCLDGNNGPKERIIVGTVVKSMNVLVKQDLTGIYYSPTNYRTELMDHEKVSMYVEIADEEQLESETAGTASNPIVVNIKEVAAYNVKNLVSEYAQDTLKNDAFYAYTRSSSHYHDLYVYEGYLMTSVSFAFKYSSAPKFYLDMYKEKVSNDTLYLRFNYNNNDESADYYTDGIFALRFPSIYELEGIQPKNDSIVIAVTAKTHEEVRYTQEGTDKTLYTKYKVY